MDSFNHELHQQVYHSGYTQVYSSSGDAVWSSKEPQIYTYTTVAAQSAIPDESLPLGYGEHMHSGNVASGRRSEKSKTILWTSFRKGFINYEFLIHSLAVVVTATVVQLTFRNVYWTDDTTWKPRWYLLNLDMIDLMNLLQFGAKLHEVLVVTSLSLMIMYIVRRQLVGRGVSLGLLTGAYQVRSTGYFINASFMSPFLKSLRRGDWRTFTLAVLIGVSIIYANMVGPASAIALLPNLDWWLVRDPFAGQPYQLILTASKAQAFSMNLTYVDDIHQCQWMLGAGAPDAFLCPGGGHQSLLDWTISVADEDVKLGISMIEPLGKVRRLLVGNVTTDNTATGGSAATIATTHSSVQTALIGALWLYINSNNIGIASSASRPRLTFTDNDMTLAPLVQDQCITYNFNALREDSSAEVLLPYDNIRLFGSENGTRRPLTVPKRYWNYDAAVEVEAVNLTWIDSEELGVDASPGTSPYRGSIAAVVVLPGYITTKIGEDGRTAEATKINYLAGCILDVRWMSTKASLDAKNDDLLSDNITDFANFEFLNEEPAHATADKAARYGITTNLIRISTNWILTVFDVPVNFSYRDYAFSDSVTVNVTHVASLFFPFIFGRELNDNTTMYTFSPPKFNPMSLDMASKLHIVAEEVASLLSMALADGVSRYYYWQQDIKLNLGPSKTAPAVNHSLADLSIQAGTMAWPPTDIATSDLQGLINNGSWLIYNVTVERYGWGYGFESRTVQFGVATVLIHSAVVTVYLVYRILFWVFGHGYSSTAWGHIGEIIALALMSRESRAMRNTAAGIERWDTWMYKVKARQRGFDRAEMIVEEMERGARPMHSVEDHDIRLVKGKKYR